MTARTVSSTLRSPRSATARGGAGVTIELWSSGAPAAGTLGDRRRIVGRAWATADDNGLWTADLEPNAGTGVARPELSIYRITERLEDGSTWSYFILVPDTPGPHDATDLEVDSTGNPVAASSILKFADGIAMRYADGTAMEYLP